MIFRRSMWVSCALLLQMFVLQCQAQVFVDFFFQFPEYTSHTVEECQTLAVQAMPHNTSTNFTGVPPYYFIAMEPGGVPVSALAGADPDHLRWQVQHPTNSSLLLTMVDSLGNSGGVAPSLYSVAAGSDTSCLPGPPPSDIPMITTTAGPLLDTCDYLILNITGGTKPYNVTIIAINVPGFTNITMGPDDDILAWPNFVPPNHQLMAAVIDANGQWGISTPIINSTGSSNTDCTGQSQSLTSGAFYENRAEFAVNTQAKSTHSAGLVAGIIVGVGVPLILLGVFIWWWRRRRNLLKAGIVDGQDARPRTWTQLPTKSSGAVSMSSSFMTETRPASPLPSKASLVELQSRAQKAPLVIYPSAPMVSSSSSSSSGFPTPIVSSSTRAGVDGYRLPTRSASTNSTSPAATRIEKSMRLLAGRSHTLPPRPYSPYMSTMSSSTSSPISMPSPLRSFPFPRQSSVLSSSFVQSSIQSPASVRLADGREPDIIIQHLDGGVVEELPPPYLDRSDSLSSISGES